MTICQLFYFVLFIYLEEGLQIISSSPFQLLRGLLKSFHAVSGLAQYYIGERGEHNTSVIAMSEQNYAHNKQILQHSRLA